MDTAQRGQSGQSDEALKRGDFLRILDRNGAPEHVKRHCLAVGDVAVNICTALIEAGFSGLDADAVRIAGYLHDITRAGKDHDVKGAELLRSIDFAEERLPESKQSLAADIIARHMKLIFPEKLDDMDEAAVVSLADRIVKEDAYVGYEARMGDLLNRYGGIPEVAARVNENMPRAQALIAQIEACTGKTIDDIATGGRVNPGPLLALVERPGRYIGGELNCVIKEWNETKFRFCFAFPDLYEIGMSYTGMQILYGLLNSRPDALCERAFAPAADMEKLLAGRGIPLFSLENRMPLRRFDMVGFTLQYELCYTNVVRMLGLAGIPLFSSERAEDDPIIIAGGPCCGNAEPVAPFFDLICVGDGEEALPALADAFLAWGNGREGKSREGFLRLCSKIPGVYAPSFYQPVYGAEKGLATGAAAVPVFSHYIKKYDDLPDRISRAVVADLETAFFPVKPLVSHIESVHDRVSVEIMRGCYRKCRFCQAGYACDGVRKRSPETVKRLLFEGLANTGYDEATLLSLSTGDYPGVEALVTELMDELSSADAVLSMPSLRLDSLKEDTLRKIAAYKRSGLTFAPEAGTQRLRDLIGKQITEDDLKHALEICLPLGFQKFKFYFMIGLPGETYEDIDGIAELARLVARHAKTLGAERGERYNFSLSVSVSNFVPKPGTPFERMKGDSEDELLAKVMYLKDAVRKVKGVGFKYHDTRMSRIEMLLAKGDRRISGVVRLAAERGAGFDGWREHFSYENWLKAFEDAGLPAEDLYSGGSFVENRDNSIGDDNILWSSIIQSSINNPHAPKADLQTQPLPWSLIGSGKAYDCISLDDANDHKNPDAAPTAHGNDIAHDPDAAPAAPCDDTVVHKATDAVPAASSQKTPDDDAAPAAHGNDIAHDPIAAPAAPSDDAVVHKAPEAATAAPDAEEVTE